VSFGKFPNLIVLVNSLRTNLFRLNLVKKFICFVNISHECEWVGCAFIHLIPNTTRLSFREKLTHTHTYNLAQFLTILLHLIFFFFFLISSSHKIFVQDAKNNVDADLVMLEELKVKCRAQTEQIMAWKKAYSMQVIELRLCDFFIFILWLFSLFMTHELRKNLL